MQWRGNVSFFDRLGDLKEEQLKRSTSLTWVHCKKGDKRFWKVVRFGLLFICLPVWCLLVFRVVSLFGWRGRERSLPSCLDYSIFLEDAFASWRSRLVGHCVLGITITSQCPSPSCSINGYQTLRECLRTTEEITWDGQVIHLAGGGGGRGRVAIPLVTSCLRNWNVLKHRWTSTNHKPFSFTMTIFLTRMIYSRPFKAIERLQGFLPEYWRSSQRRKKLRAVSCEELPWRAQVQICTNMFWC